jgi:cysteinyl-tRNA synthetase
MKFFFILSSMLHLYNTLSRKLEPFKPLSDEKIKFYLCGPTVYNYAHIGNLCCYTFNDIIIRSLEFLGYSVDALMNLTDIDDKTIRDSQKEKTTLKAFTESYTKIFLKDLEKLNITSFSRKKPISELVPEMIAMTQQLINTNHAYISDDGSVYFDIKSFKNYGNLAHLDMKGMKAGARVNSDEYDKENVSDFALWKGYDQADGENFWNAEFVLNHEKILNWRLKIEDWTFENKKVVLKWRPGWHIECSACNLWGHGEQIDIHSGGIDLIFPHHQNEIAQTESVTGKTFSTYWMHTGHLLVDGKKMSKSLGNMYTLSDIENKFPEKKNVLYRAFRMMCLQNRYRENFNFTFERLEGAMATVTNFDNTLKRIKSYTPRNTKVRREFRDAIQASMQGFVEALENDIDTLTALTAIFEFITLVNRDIDDESLTTKEVSSVIDILKSWDMVMGVMDWSILEVLEIPESITALAEERIAAKKNKDFTRADEIRKEVESLGYLIVDMKDGFNLEKK